MLITSTQALRWLFINLKQALNQTFLFFSQPYQSLLNKPETKATYSNARLPLTEKSHETWLSHSNEECLYITILCFPVIHLHPHPISRDYILTWWHNVFELITRYSTPTHVSHVFLRQSYDHMWNVCMYDFYVRAWPAPKAHHVLHWSALPQAWDFQETHCTTVI